MTEQAVAVREPVQGLALGRAPEVVLAEAARAASCLRDVMQKKKTKVIINDEQYIEFEDWSTVGSFYNVSGGAEDAIPIDVFGIQGAKAMGFAIKTDTGLIISRAVAYCMRDEPNWEDRPWFQLASMAQTRATAKALKNVLSRVVVLAGYKPTPAEEMAEGAARRIVSPPCPKCGNTKSVIIGKAEFGGGWVCWKKRNGCGHSWGAEEPRGGLIIEGEPPKGGDAHELARTTSGVDTAPPPPAEGGGEPPRQSRLDLALKESAEKDEWWAEVDKERQRAGKTKAWLTQYVMKTYGKPDPRTLELEEVKTLAMYLGTLEMP